LDFRLSKNDEHHYIEVKNVTLGRNGEAQFPDAVTERGQKHLKELMSLMKKGHSAELVFVIQREDCKAFSPADDIDPEYGKLLRQAIKQGVRVTALTTKLSPLGIRLTGEVLQVRI
jgi:sugar fermentation stimulation protein A